MTNSSWPLMINNINRSDLNALIEFLSGDDPKLTQGPKVLEFEKLWSEWLGVKHSVMVNSGSSANDLTMIALKELYGTGEVIVPPLTWVSDISSIIRSGLEPVFVDINRNSLAMDTDLIIDAITPKTKAIFLTHVLGFNGLTEKLLGEISARNILLIEDVCESHGAEHNGRKLGTFGWASNFSFYYAHHMSTIEGGIISTNDSELFDILLMLRSHGMVRECTNKTRQQEFQNKYSNLNSDFIFAFPSHNMRSTELNAVLGLEQLKRIDINISLRNKNFRKFLSLLDSNVFQVDFVMEGCSNYALTLILKTPNYALRNNIEQELHSSGIEFRRGLSGGGNQLRQPYLKNLKNLPPAENFPNVEHVHNFGWYIGNYPELQEFKLIELADLLKKVVKSTLDSV